MKAFFHTAICGLVLTVFTSSTAFSAVVANATPVVEGMNNFAFDLYKQTISTDENQVLAPYSLSSLLGILANGASGNTFTQIMDVLHIDERQDMYDWMTELNGIENTLRSGSPCEGWVRCQLRRWWGGNSQSSQFASANALWAEDHLSYKNTFLNFFQRSKSAQFFTVNFSVAPEQERRRINRWAKKNTGGMIKELLAPGMVTTETKLVLTNALFFKGLWQLPFKPDDTQPQSFTLDGGKSVTVPTMQQHAKFYYAENDLWQMLQLPYDKSSLAMVILLPKSNHALQDLERNLNFADFSQLLRESYLQPVTVSLPTFTITSTLTDLAKSLEKMGLVEAFGKDANFSNMTQDALFISDIIQKVMIQVNEEGTVAAAATATVMDSTAYLPPVTFTANHPFMFIIYDTKSKILLFMGHVVHPQVE